MKLIIGMTMLGFLMPLWFEAANPNRGPLPVLHQCLTALALGLIGAHFAL